MSLNANKAKTLNRTPGPSSSVNTMLVWKVTNENDIGSREFISVNIDEG